MTDQSATVRRGSIDEEADLETLDLRRFNDGVDPWAPVRMMQTGFKRGRGFYRETVAKWGFVELGRVIDVGCGYARWSVFLAEVNERLYGIERNEGGVVLSRNLSAHLGLGNTEYDVGDVSEIPCEAESFDGAWCFGVAHVVDRARMLREIHRILVPGGALFLGAFNSTARVLEKFFEGYRAGGLSADKTRFALRALRRW